MLQWFFAATGFVSYALGQELLAAKHEFPGLPTVIPLGSKVITPVLLIRSGFDGDCKYVAIVHLTKKALTVTFSFYFTCCRP